MASLKLVALVLALVSVNTRPFSEYCLDSEKFKKEVNSELYLDLKKFCANKAIIFNVSNLYLLISSINFNEGNVLIREQSVKTEQRKEAVKRELDFFISINDFNISPKYLGCLSTKDTDENVIMIHDATNKSLKNDELQKLFKSFDLSKKMLTILKIAILIYNLNSHNNYHNNISLLSIVSTDEKLSEVRLVNFSNMFNFVRETKEYYCEFYRNSALFDREKVKANINPDAYSFVMTMLTLLNPMAELSNQNKITMEFLKNKKLTKMNEGELKELAELQIQSITTRLKVEFKKVPILEDLMNYIDNALLQGTEKLSMHTLIVKLIESIETIKSQPNIHSISEDYLQKIENEYKISFEEFKKLNI